VILLDGGSTARHRSKDRPGGFRASPEGADALVAGKFDWIFLGKDALVKVLGAPAADKKVVLLDNAHDVSEKREDLVREVVAWLDKYLGKVN